jgi:NitT/TauT family transport system substrate-binding protein
MGCVIVRNEFLEEHPEAVKAFIEKLDSSIKFANENPKDAGTLCETYGIVPKAALATKAIPNCNMMLIKGADMKPAIEGYFTVLHAANPKSVGGALPDEGFYYIP